MQPETVISQCSFGRPVRHLGCCSCLHAVSVVGREHGRLVVAQALIYKLGSVRWGLRSRRQGSGRRGRGADQHRRRADRRHCRVGGLSGDLIETDALYSARVAGRSLRQTYSFNAHLH